MMGKEGKKEGYEIDRYEDSKGNWRWRIKANNGNIIASSTEGYSSKQNLNDNIKLIGLSIERDSKN